MVNNKYLTIKCITKVPIISNVEPKRIHFMVNKTCTMKCITKVPIISNVEPKRFCDIVNNKCNPVKCITKCYH